MVARPAAHVASALSVAGLLAGITSGSARAGAVTAQQQLQQRPPPPALPSLLALPPHNPGVASPISRESPPCQQLVQQQHHPWAATPFALPRFPWTVEGRLAPLAQAQLSLALLQQAKAQALALALVQAQAQALALQTRLREGAAAVQHQLRGRPGLPVAVAASAPAPASPSGLAAVAAATAAARLDAAAAAAAREEHEVVEERRGRKRLKCNRCGRLLWGAYAMRRHLRTHTNERPFACPLCNRSFRQKSTLSSHMQVHDKSLPSPFSCCQCGTTFRHRSSLNRHLRTAHKDSQVGLSSE